MDGSLKPRLSTSKKVMWLENQLKAASILGDPVVLLEPGIGTRAWGIVSFVFFIGFFCVSCCKSAKYLSWLSIWASVSCCRLFGFEGYHVQRCKAGWTGGNGKAVEVLLAFGTKMIVSSVLFFTGARFDFLFHSLLVLLCWRIESCYAYFLCLSFP